VANNPCMPTLHIGVQLPTTDGLGEGHQDLAAVAREAENTGFDSVWVGDHFAFNVPVLESIVAATTAAAVTERVHVGFGVMLAALRHPGWLAKHISSLQVVSANRVELGVGVGGEFEAEWNALGVPLTERGPRTESILAALPDLMSGVQVRLGDPWAADVPPLEPHGIVPPIWIGGRSDAALRRVVRHGSGWLGLWCDEARLSSSRERLQELAAESDRPAPRIALEVIVNTSPDGRSARQDASTYMETIYRIPYDRVQRYVAVGTEEAVTETLTKFVDSGVDTLILISTSRSTLNHMDSLARVADAVRTSNAANLLNLDNEPVS
jgi:alkanesulfonate monooxygenase SsuD/methylene tetrahydromethanopterin reductase-like flavin-dependent oxidoreductase (luciferase family)